MANSQPQVPNPTLTIVSLTKNSVSLRWNKATDLETPQSKLRYTVTWCVKPYVWDNNVRKIGEAKYDNTSYTITGLTPNTTYEIILYVRDEGGYENTYARTTITTPPDTVVDSAPTIPNKVVSITRINTTSLEISWQKATDKETAQKNLRYVVTWTPGPDYATSNRKQSAYMTDTTTYKITGLLPDQSYRISVYVYDGKNFSVYNALYAKTAKQAGASSTNNSASIKSFLSGVPYSPTALINNDLYNDKTLYPDALESLPDREAAFILTKTETKISNKEIYVRGSGYENIYPGAILLVDTDLTSGNPTPLSVARNKITIYGDFLAGGNPEQANIEPNNAEVRKATNRIMETLLNDSRYHAPGMQQPCTKIYTSEKSLMMDFAVDASYAGVSLKVNAKTDAQESSFIQATTLEQDYFTVKLKDNWRQDPSSLFDKSVTVEQLRKAMNGKALAIVTSVTYGRTFSYLKEYSAKKYSFDSSQKITAYGQSASSNQKGSESVTSTNEDIFNLGGTALTIAALKSKKTQAELEEAMADNMNFSRSNQGVVTKYTIQLVTGTTPGKVLKPLFNGTQYQIGYARCPRRLSMYVNVGPVRVGGPGGGDVEVHLDVQCFRVQDNRPVIFRTVNSSSSSKIQDPWYYKFNNSKTREFGNLGVGEYIYINPFLRILSRASKVSRWTTDDTRRLNHGEIESGEMQLYLKGDVARAVKIDKINP